jgi:guanine nucleotide-binding protein subunit alpha
MLVTSTSSLLGVFLFFFQKQIFTHVTCATDSDQMKFVFDACKEIILQENLRSNGFMY